jgi:hypothetical protein
LTASTCAISANRTLLANLFFPRHSFFKKIPPYFFQVPQKQFNLPLGLIILLKYFFLPKFAGFLPKLVLCPDIGPFDALPGVDAHVLNQRALMIAQHASLICGSK